MADTQGSLTEALGVVMDHPGPVGVLGAPRCERHAVYVEDGIIKAFEVAASPDDPAGDAKPDVSLVENMMSKVPDLSPGEQQTAFNTINLRAQEDITAVKSAILSAELALF